MASVLRKILKWGHGCSGTVCAALVLYVGAFSSRGARKTGKRRDCMLATGHV